MLCSLRRAISGSRIPIPPTRVLVAHLFNPTRLAQSGDTRAVHHRRRMAESHAGTGGDHRGADAGDGTGKAKTSTVHTTERLVALRALMKEHQVDV